MLLIYRIVQDVAQQVGVREPLVQPDVLAVYFNPTKSIDMLLARAAHIGNRNTERSDVF